MTKDPKRAARDAALDALVARCNDLTPQLDSWTAFVREVKVPEDLLPALMTGRIELLRLLQPRAMTEEQVALLLNLIAVLVETNSALRAHAEMTSQLVGTWASAFKHLQSVGQRVERFAGFCPEEEATDEA